MRNWFKYVAYLIVTINFSFSHAGSYEDFFQAVKHDEPQVIAGLFQRGFDPNTRNPDGLHALHLAIQEPAPKVIELLLTHPRIDVDPRNQHDETPLMLAALKGLAELAERLIEHESDLNKPGWTPLHYAATSGQVAIIRLLLEHHAYIDAGSPNGSTPLMMAAMYGTPAAVKVLLEAGADPLQKNDLGLTALDFARQANRPDSATLIEAFAQAAKAQPPLKKKAD